MTLDEKNYEKKEKYKKQRKGLKWVGLMWSKLSRLRILTGEPGWKVENPRTFHRNEYQLRYNRLTFTSRLNNNIELN